jgi:beta-glucosidase
MDFAGNGKDLLRKIISLFSVFFLILSVTFQSLPAVVAADSVLPIYLDSSKSVEARVTDLLNKMTLDEKVGQMLQPEKASITTDDVKNYYIGSVLSGGGSFPGKGTEEDSTRENWTNLYNSFQDAALSTRLGIPIIYGVDAVHGHNNVKGATIFPHSIGLAASRDTDLVKRVGAAVAREVKATGVNWTFTPMLGDPQNERWGRTNESFGDNIDLIAKMGAAYIQGLQGDTIDDLKNPDKVIATAKHYIGEGWTDNGTNQGNVSTMTKEQVAAQLIKPFKAAVDAGVRTIMASYNSIQGVKCHASKYLLTDILKKQLGFDGIVVSDYNGIEQINKDEDGNPVSGLKQQVKTSVNAGMDMFMETGNWKNCINCIKDLVNDEKTTPGTGIQMSRIDDAVSRILRVKFQAGLFKNPKANPQLVSNFGSKEDREVSREAVRKSLVLLKNDNITLNGNTAPILSQLKTMKNIFVAGKNANDLGNQCGGWTITWQGESGNNHTTGTTILKGIQDSLQYSGKNVSYNKYGRVPAGSDVAIVVVGETPYAESNGDTNNLSLDQTDLATLANVKKSGVPTIVVSVSGRPLMVTNQLKDWAGFIQAWLPGSEGEGVADVLFGDYDFTGKLPIKWPFYTEALSLSKDAIAPYLLFNFDDGLTKAEATQASVIDKLDKVPSMPEAAAIEVPDKAKVTKISGTAVSSIKLGDDWYDLSGWDAKGTQFTENPTNLPADSPTGSKGSSVGWTSAGKWLRYAVDVEKEGWYKVDFCVSGNGSGGSNAITLKDKHDSTLCSIPAPSTGGWNTGWTPATGYVNLTSGKQPITFYVSHDGFNIAYMNFTKVDAPPTVPVDNGKTVTQTGDILSKDAVKVWMSTEVKPKDLAWYYNGDQINAENAATQKKLEPSTLDITKADNGNSDITKITVDPMKKYQDVTGIGSSLELSTVNNILKMSPAKQQEFVNKLIDPVNGAGMSMMRLTIGTPDFIAGDFYTYDDMPAGQTDPNLDHFSIQKDIDKGIVKVANMVKTVNPNVKFFASMWSAPGWMKATDSMIRGQLKDEYIPALAKYYVKYLQAYKAQGIDISAITLQNEPLFEGDYPSGNISWQQEATLSILTRKELDNNGFGNVKIWTFDHNPSDTMAYPAQILKDNTPGGAYDAIEGTAFHDYGGELSEMTRLHNMYPEKDVYLTERSVWGTEGMDRIAQYFRNWAKSYNSWVIMLDSDIAEHHWTGTPDPTMFVEDAANRDNYWATPEYYLTGQYSKFIKPGFIRIDSNYGSSDKVTNVSFLDPSTGNINTVVINQTDKNQPFKIACHGQQVTANLPAKTVGTYVWKPVDGVDDNTGVSGAISGDTAYTPSSTISFMAGAAAKNVNKWTADDGQLKNGTSGESYADYTINVPETGNYAVDIRYGGSGSRTFKLDYGTGSSADLVGSATSSWEAWHNKSVRQIIHLDAGTQNIRLNLKSQDDWTDVRSLTFTKMQNLTAPVKVDALQATGYGELAVSTSVADSVYYFENTSGDTWMQYKVNAVNGGKCDIVYNTATKNDGAKIKLQINGVDAGTVDVNNTGDWGVWKSVYQQVTLPAGTVTLTVYEQNGGFNFGGFTIQSPKFYPEIQPVLSYNTDGQVADVVITNGVFVKDKVSGITLTAPTGAEASKIYYIDPTHVRILLKNTITDGQTLSVNVPVGAYNVASGYKDDIALSGSVKCSNPINRTEVNAISDTANTVINSVYCYNFDNATLDTDNNKLSFSNGGGWADYYVNVAKDGDYVVDLNLSPLSAVTNGIQLMEGTNTLCTFSAPYADGSQIDIRSTAHLTAGEHHLKLNTFLGGFKLNSLKFEPKTSHVVGTTGTTIEAESYYAAKQAVIQSNTNLGYLNAGDWMDYDVDVQEGGDYTVDYNYATAQGGVSASFLVDGKEISKTPLSSTGGWTTYLDALDGVTLTQGKHTIRIIDNGDGFNIDKFTLTKGKYGQGSSEKAAVPVATTNISSNGIQKVEFNTDTNGAKIYYTLDGSMPTTSSNQYTAPISVYTTSIFRAIAVKDGNADSYVALSNMEPLFAIQNALIDRQNGIKASADVHKQQNYDSYVVFELMDGTTPVTITSQKLGADTDFSALTKFNGITGDLSKYSVKVFIFDRLIDDKVTNAPVSLAEPQEVK